MALLELMRTLGALAVVLGILAGGLWVVKRYNIALPGRVGGNSDRRLQLVERLSMDTKRSAVLLRRDGQEHLIILSPEGNMLVESMKAPTARKKAPANVGAKVAAPAKVENAKKPPKKPSAEKTPNFAALVEEAAQAEDSKSLPERVQRLRDFAQRVWLNRNLSRADFAKLMSERKAG